MFVCDGCQWNVLAIGEHKKITRVWMKSACLCSGKYCATHTRGLLIWFSYLIYDWGVINGPFNSAFTHRARTHTYTYIFINYLHWIWFIRFGFGDHFSPLLQIIIHSSVGNMKFMERCAALTQLLIYLFTASRGVLQMFKLVSRYDAVHTRKHSLSITYDAMGISINQHSFFVYKMFLEFFYVGSNR